MTNSSETSQTFNVINQLLNAINQATVTMNKSFEQTILKHQEHFIKTYRIKMIEVNNLYQQLKKTLEDKLINNSLMNRLDIVTKQRDYFKYQCLKLNGQYQGLLEDQKNLNLQAKNLNQQLEIYKHLLEDQKIRSNHNMQINQELKDTLTVVIQKTNPIHYTQPLKDVTHSNFKSLNQQLNQQIKIKNQKIRTLQERLQACELAINNSYNSHLQKKNLQNLFKSCVLSWKRQQITKMRGNRIETEQQYKKISDWSIQQFSTASKKQLLKKLFVSPQFLQFIQQLLFDQDCKVVIEKVKGDKYMESNRKKLYNYLKKKKIFTQGRNNLC